MDVLDILERCQDEVKKYYDSCDKSHSMEHINRVFNLSIVFSNELKELKPNVLKVGLISLCHDLDDYKLFNTTNNHNALDVLSTLGLDSDIINDVINAINEIGYSKRLSNITPTTIEAKIVSDSDMCDALGINGILRTYDYSRSINRPFFDKNVFPVSDINSEDYKLKANSTGINHFFEKLLRLKDMMLTPCGRMMAKDRTEVMVEFLRNFFLEEGCYEWLMYLDDFLEKK